MRVERVLLKIDKALIKLFKNGVVLSICKHCRIRPNGLTLFRMGLIPFIVLSYLNDRVEISCVLFLIAAILDAFDGPLARATGAESKIGAILDPLADKLLFIFTLYLFYSYVWRYLFWALISVEISLMVLRGLIWYIYKKRKKSQPAMKANYYGKFKFAIEAISVTLLYIHIIFDESLMLGINILLCIALGFSFMSAIKQGQKLPKGS